MYADLVDCVSERQFKFTRKVIELFICTVQFNLQKTASDCRQRWLSVVSQSVNKAEWTKEETVKLMKLGKEFGGRNWKEITKRMEVSPANHLPCPRRVFLDR